MSYSTYAIEFLLSSDYCGEEARDDFAPFLPLKGIHCGQVE